MSDFQPINESSLGQALQRLRDILKDQIVPSMIKRMESHKWVVENMVDHYVAQQKKDTDG